MRSAIGPYLALLGASATAVGIVAGHRRARRLRAALLERLARRPHAARTGRSRSPATRRNLVAVPLLALAGSWPMVAALVALERLGKAVRSPAKSTLTSFAATRPRRRQGVRDQRGDGSDRRAARARSLVAGVLAWRGATTRGLRLGVRAARRCPPRSAIARAAARAPAVSRSARARDATPADDSRAARPALPRCISSASRSSRSASPTGRCSRSTSRRRDVAAGAWLPIAYAGGDGRSTAWCRSPRACCSIAARARGGTGAGVLAVFVIAGAAYAPLAFAAHAICRLAIAGIALWSVVHAGDRTRSARR